MSRRSDKRVPRKRPRQARASATVEALLAAAAESFEQSGLAGSNVNQIAARAGISIGSLYQYYPSKEALLVALIERHTRESLDTLEAALLESAQAPLERAVRHVVRCMIEAHSAPLHRVLARELDALGRLDELERSVDERAGRAVLAFLRARPPSDAIEARDPEFAAFVLIRTVDLVTHAVLSERPNAFANGVLLDELSALVLGYLRSKREA